MLLAAVLVSLPCWLATPPPRHQLRPVLQSRSTELVAASSQHRPVPASSPPPPQAVFMAAAFLMSSCFGVIAQALPAALMDATSKVRAVTILGQLGSASAFCEVFLSNSFGKLVDAIGRKPVLIFAPAAAVAARTLVVVRPALPVLVTARFLTSLLVPLFWLAFQSSMADMYGDDATKLAVLSSRVAACMGLGYSIATLLGGKLAARSVRLAYLASCLYGIAVCLLLLFGMSETLPASRRKPFSFSGTNPLLFMRLFQRGRVFGTLNGVVLLQAMSNGMGDLWQVLARELRGWGPSQCGSFASISGLSFMAGTLLTAPALRLLGPRRYTLVSTAASVSANVVLAHGTSDAIAYAGVAPAALGAGKGQPVSARIVNLAEQQRLPQVCAHPSGSVGMDRVSRANNTSTFTACASLMCDAQGALAAERSTLNAIVKVVAPSTFAYVFARGSALGVPVLPFYLAAFLLTLSGLLAATVPASEWR
tara:strand:+ start:346 stop:1785 length:1440 start_codon:yes stop_codon:yes gene_type:complete